MALTNEEHEISTPNPPAAKTVVEMQDVSFAYEDLPILENVSLDILANDFLGLIGPNGGGKTTLVKLILGLLRPDSGTVRAFGQSPHRVRKRIGYVPQYARFDRNFPLSVREVVSTGRMGHAGFGRRFRPEDRQAVARVMDDLELSALAERPLRALSGGELQRVLVARALACEPQLLILDEPTSSVDSRIEKAFYDMLRELNRRIPVVLVSHDLGFISAYLTRVACLNRRLEVNPVSEVHAHDLEAMYGAPVRAWSHDCEL